MKKINTHAAQKIAQKACIGFTLIEIILYVAITSILLTFTTIFVIQIWSGTNNVNDESKQHAEFTIVLERMNRELEGASSIISAQSVFENASSKIVFVNGQTGGTDTMELAGSGIIQIRRSNGTTDSLTTTESPLDEFWIEIKNLPKRPPAFYIRLTPKGGNVSFESLIALHSLISL